MSKFKIGNRVIVREGINEGFYSEGAIGVITGKKDRIVKGALEVYFYEGSYITCSNGQSNWAVLPQWVKSLEKGKARPPKKPITSITKKYKFTYRNIVTLEKVEIYKVNTLKETENILIKLRRKGFKWSTDQTINKNDFTKHYRKHFGKFTPIYIWACPNGSISWIEVEKGNWAITKIK